MTRISKTFKKLKADKKKGLITFLTAGDPSVEKSLEALLSLPAAGADFIEIGMPFTDPMADGPAIQASSLRALTGGMNMGKTLDMVKKFRTKDDKTPIILMGYFNPVYKYGCEKFVSDAKSAGADGLIIVDLPPEEDAELRVPAQAAGLDLIRLITPTTIGTRLDTVLENASGFLYYVSITGVTGTKSANIDEVGAHIDIIKGKTDIPVAVGFGIKTPADAAAMAKVCDAVVVGSALVEKMAAGQDIANDVVALKAAI